ncbi:MAG: S8 family serine peptidase [Ignavibacteriaceae bacterium]|nr:S8 family serine peptidase [Ignavibacteriaceae bacterium]
MKSQGKLLLLILTTLFSFSLYAGGGVIKKGDVAYISGELIIKLNYDVNTDMFGSVNLNEPLLQNLTYLGIKEVKVLFTSENLSYRQAGLSRIISVKYDKDYDPQYISSKIKNSPGIEWAEPRFAYAINFIPNDPSLSQQWYLPKVNAYEAWDINQGSENIVIAINDTGSDWDHPDLAGNIWSNPGEIPNNGIDDDGNGYIDDVRGWDFGGSNGTPDNDPMEDQPDHGTHVAGLSSAVSNNGVGVSSLASKSKLMIVKTSRNDTRDPSSGQPYIMYGYEGIVYAADNGAHIVNCSWGGGGYSIFGQETILYALNKGTLVVAAAGNSNSQNAHFPSGYNHVFSVAASASSDAKASFSNYGYSIDVTAPGQSMYNTWQNNVYATLSGTSMASPLVSSLVALVMANFPNLTAVQAAEKVRVSTDDIYNVNPVFNYKLGSGRINALKALSNTNFISVRINDFVLSDEVTGNGDGIFEPGETITLAIAGLNYLQQTSSLQIELFSQSNYATVTQNPIINAGSLLTNQTFSNSASPFHITLANVIPADQDLTFLIRITDANYSDFQMFTFPVNTTYGTVSGNNTAITITSKGNLGYADYPNNTKGSGFTFNGGGTILFEGSLIIGTGPTKLLNAARGSNQSVQDQHFTRIQPLQIKIPGNRADVESRVVFSDASGGSNQLGLEIMLDSYSFSDVTDENYIIMKYTMKNTSGSEITGMYAGLFFDWDLVDGSGDRADWSQDGNFGYVEYTGTSTTKKVAVALISEGSPGYWAINNAGDASWGIYDGYSATEKWQSISSGLSGKLSAGTGDVSNVISAGPYNISAGSELTVAFVIAGGTSLDGLRSSVAAARAKYPVVTSIKEIENNEGLPLSFSLEQNYPNPFNPSTVVRFSIPEAGNISLKVYDVIGNLVGLIKEGYSEAGNFETVFDGKNLSSGVYILELKAGKFSKQIKMMLMK